MFPEQQDLAFNAERPTFIWPKGRSGCCDFKLYLGALMTHVYNGHCPGQPVLAGTRMAPFWILLELRMMEMVLTTGGVRRAKAPVKSSPPTNQHPTFLQAAMPFLSPKQQLQSTEGRSLVIWSALEYFRNSTNCWVGNKEVIMLSRLFLYLTASYRVIFEALLLTVVNIQILHWQSSAYHPKGKMECGEALDNLWNIDLVTMYYLFFFVITCVINCVCIHRL